MVLRWIAVRSQQLIDLRLSGVACLSASCIYNVTEQCALQRKRLRRIMCLEWVKPEQPATPDEGIVSALQARRTQGPFQKKITEGSRIGSPFFLCAVLE